MKKFKPNTFTTALFAMIEVLIPFSVGAPVMMFLMNKEAYSMKEIFLTFPLFLLMIALLPFFSGVLNLVTLPFTEYTVFLYEDSFSRGETKVRYDSVTRIEIDSGVMRRFGTSEHCCLDCYGGDMLLISIEHPSLWMCFLVMRRCKNAKIRYKRIKKVLALWAFCLFLCVILGLCGKT